MPDPKLKATISADSTELDKSLKKTTQEIKKVSQEATKAQQEAKKSVAQVADSLNKSGTEAAKSLSKMAMGMSSVAAWGMAVVGALKQIYDLYQNYVNKAMERSLELSRQNTSSLTQATDSNVNKWQKATQALKEYYALQKQMASNPNAVTAERLRQSGAGLEQYGIKGNTPEEQLDFAKAQEIKALEGAIKSLEKEQNRLDALIGKTSDKTEGGIALINSLQGQKNSNNDAIMRYRGQLHDLERTDIAGNWQREQLAQQADATQKQIIQAQQELYKAQKDYATALQNAKTAQSQLDAVKKQQARDARADMLANRRENLARQMANFSFALSDGFDLNMSGKALSDRRRQLKLDAGIAEKLAKQESGERVHWTTAEKARIKDFQRLQGKDKALEAQQKQMDAADKQKQAAEALQRAANALIVANSMVNGNAISTARRRLAGAKNAWWENEAAMWALGKEAEQKQAAEVEERAKKTKEAKQREINAKLAAHNRANLESNRGNDPIVQGIINSQPSKIDAQNAEYLRGIYENTKDIGGNIFIVR